MRQTLYDQFNLCRYMVPATVSGEMDVAKFEAMKRHGSRTAHYIQAVSKCLKKHPRVNAGFVRNFWTNSSRIVHWNTVDAAVSVDKKFGDDRYPFVHVIRNSDKLTVKEIDDEIRYVTETAVENIPAFANYLRFMKLPHLVRRMMMHKMICDSDLMKSRIGTFSFTNISFWGFKTASLNTPRLLVGVGAPSDEGKLPIGYSFNHVICDGAQIGEFHRDVVRFFRKCEFE
ncbi:MAG: 2-oxo acid dehydrogenase subunit E2 [Bdellovibrionales bacterium]